MTAVLGGVAVLVVGDDPGSADAGRILAALGADVASAMTNAPGDRRLPDPGRRTGAWDVVLGAEAVVGPSKGRAVAVSRFPSGIAADRQEAERELAGRYGLVAMSGDPSGPPLAPPHGVVGPIVGAHLAATALAGLIQADRTGRPTRLTMDVGRAVMSCISPMLATVARSGEPWKRLGNRSIGLTPGIVAPCADGFVLVGVGNDGDWAALGRICDLPEPIIERYTSAAMRRTSAPEIGDLLKPWLTGRTRREVFQTGQAIRVPLAPALAPAEALLDEHVVVAGLNPRRSQREVVGPPFEWAPTRGCGPHDDPGRHARAPARLPLAGVRILDLTAVWAGPYAGFLLSTLGADVVKIEAPNRPDGTRVAGSPPTVGRVDVDVPTVDDPLGRSPVFDDLNRGKRSLTLDLGSLEGVALFRHLLSSADLVIDNYSPRVLVNFGLAVDEILGEMPHLSWLSMPAFGLSGPYRDFVALGAGLEMLSGLAWLTGAGYGDGRPHLLGFPVTDCLAGLHATIGALALLRCHGRGHLVVTQLASALGLVASTITAPGHVHPGSWDEAADLGFLLEKSDLQDDFEFVDHGRARSLRHLRPAWSGGPLADQSRRAPSHGEHSFQVLSSRAGIDREGFRRLRRAGVTSQASFLPR